MPLRLPVSVASRNAQHHTLPDVSPATVHGQASQLMDQRGGEINKGKFILRYRM
jgi:hypothetical protein